MNALSRKVTTKSLLTFAIPTVITMVFTNIYSMVDGIFVSRVVGTDALSAINLVYPFIIVAITIGIMLAAGGSAVVARKMGEGKGREAREDFTMLIIVGAGLGFLTTALGLLFLEPLLYTLGANAVVYEYCETYLTMLLFFFPPLMLQVLFQTFFATAGKAGLGLGFVVAGGMTNIALDYLFIAVYGWGLAGAALATGLGYCVPGILGLLYFLFHRKGSLYLVRPKFRLTVLWESVTNGASEMVSNLASSVTVFLYNIIMMRMAGQDGVAAITILLYTDSLMTAVYFGFAMGIAPVISYNYGEGNTENLRKIKKISLTTLVVCGISIFAFVTAFTKPLVSVFAPAGSYVFELAASGLPVFGLCYLVMGVNIFASALFTALSNGKVSAMLAFLRTLVFLVFGIVTLPQLFGITGVWLAVPFAEILALAVSVGCMKKYEKVYCYGNAALEGA